jgi:hypothetical protein
MLSHIRLPQFVARAAETWDVQFEDVATIKSLEALFANVIQFVVSISGVAFFIMLLVGGFSFLFSAGDAKKLEQARGTLTNAIVGLIVVVSAYIILRIIGVFTGTSDLINTFQIGQ